MTYVTKDDFLKFSGRDLELEFKNGNFDIKEPVPIFISRVETATIELLKDRYDNYGLEDKIKANLEGFKEAMLWQINYILDNGELYNSDGAASRYLSPIAKSKFTNLGMCNLRRFYG